jgi:hypothetical protein
MPSMGQWGATFAAVGLVLVAAAPVVSEAAGGPGWAKAVPGLAHYAGGRYCITQTPPYETTTTPDTVTIWTELGGQTVQSGSYNMHDAAQVTNLRAEIGRAVKIEECWSE